MKGRRHKEEEREKKKGLQEREDERGSRMGEENRWTGKKEEKKRITNWKGMQTCSFPGKRRNEHLFPSVPPGEMSGEAGPVAGNRFGRIAFQALWKPGGTQISSAGFRGRTRVWKTSNVTNFGGEILNLTSLCDEC